MPRFGDVRLEPTKPMVDRRTRRPQHPFLLQQLPFALQPCFIAPVLPGETLKNATVNIRVLSEPIRNAVTGWWYEFYMFYVRLADLDIADALRDAIVDPSKPLSGVNTNTNARIFHQNGNYPSFVMQCLNVVTRAYFRDETDATLGPYTNILPLVKVQGTGWYDSLIKASSLSAETGTDDWEKKWSIYQQVRNAKLTTKTFEEYLAGTGVEVPPQLREPVQDFRRPELVRFVRDFVQPQQVIEPTTGLPSAVVQWNVAERIDKRRFFDQPGFLAGYVVARPKAFMRNHKTSVSDILLSSAEGWMPVEHETDPHASLLSFGGDTVGGAAGAGPVHKVNAGVGTYWLDRRDLFLRGEQFINFNTDTIPGADSVMGAWSLFDLPDPALANDMFPTEAEAQGLFTTATRQYLKVDGIVSLRIASRITSDATA